MENDELISRAGLLAGIEELKESPWYNFGKVDGTSPEGVEAIWHYGYLQRKEAVEVIEDMCIKKEPAVLADSSWISVKDRLPEYDKTVLVVNEDGYMHTAVRIKGSIAKINEWQIKFGVCFNDNDVWDDDEQGIITHWQPLPEPPKEDKNDN